MPHPSQPHRRPTLLTLPTLVALALCAQACPGELEGFPVEGANSTTLDDTNPVLPGGPQLTFNQPRDPACDARVFLGQVGGRVVDETGAPMADALAQLCVRHGAGELTCVRPSRTEANGNFIIDVPAEIRCLHEAAMRVALPRSTMSTLYCDLPLPTDRTAFVHGIPLRLHATQPATSLPPSGDPDAPRTVTFSDGLEIDLIPSRFFPSTGAYEDLSARRLDPAAESLCFIGDRSRVYDVYALAPEGDVVDATFNLRIPNTRALPPNTAVALYVLGGLSCHLSDGSLVPEAQWQQFGTGRVSADGRHIVGEGPDGLPCLTWLGYGPL